MDPLTIAAVLGGGFFLAKKNKDKATEATRANFKGPSGTTWQTTVDKGWFSKDQKSPTVDVYFPLPSADVKASPCILRFRELPGKRALVSQNRDPKYATLVNIALRDFSVTKVAGPTIAY